MQRSIAQLAIIPFVPAAAGLIQGVIMLMIQMNRS
jgi:hypothetical protein